MPDDPSEVGPQDRSRINIHQDYGLDYWSEHYGVTRERLKAAVEKVGPSVKAVEETVEAGVGPAARPRWPRATQAAARALSCGTSA